MSNPTEDRKVIPLNSQLRYHVGPALDVLKLGELVDEWHSLVCSSMPGVDIESIHYNSTSTELVVTFR